MNKGIVMEITDRSIIVMRSDGKFQRVSRKKRNCEIGEEIVYADAGINWRSPSVAGRSAIAAAVIFCLVLFASFNGKLGSPEVVAYVSMDINPSIEMGLDVKENVIELRGLNDDGVDLIQTVDYKGKSLENVAGKLLDKAEQKSLARGEAEIVIASTAVGDNTKVSDTAIAEKLRQQVTKHIETTHPTQVSSYQVAAFAAPQEVREAAVQNGVSTGKYAVYLNAKNSGTDITLDELKKESVLQISKEKPEVAKLIQPGALPSKADYKKLVDEEKSGQLDKKLEDKLKDKKDNNGNAKSSSNSSNTPAKNGQSGSNGSNNSNGSSNNQNGKDDPRKPGTTNGSGGSSNGKDNKSDDKKDDRKDNKPATTRPSPTPTPNSQTKPGATGPGNVRPGDNKSNDDSKNNDKKNDSKDSKDDSRGNGNSNSNEDDKKKDDAKKSEEERRREEADRRLEELKQKAEEQKKEQDKKDDGRKSDDSKKKDDDKKDSNDSGRKS
ncbi:anti-sigma factor domain-containing protein [Paenibacillus cremeus]|uniref:Anti-sigma factor domain-containing protein n=1 Tax=Paenibacillus cremeus TaxID=2163881 RepID=A0A559KC67_9BACL|nr:anti-sigma factor domain-containing protein [Paenibacillus cremeus]TVY09717.1 anti-sigma factor domain-containing protein [Paenibacillus cremeus]